MQPVSPTTRPTRALLPILFAALSLAASCGDDGPLPVGGDDTTVRADTLDVPRLDLPGDAKDDGSRDPGPDTGADVNGQDPGTDPADVLEDPDVSEDDSPADVPPLDCPPAGAVLISELMPDPSASPDATGEWFEVLNPGTTDVDLRGMQLRSGNEVHAVGGGSPVIVPAGGVLLLAASADTAANGGITPGYVYAKIKLTNSDDDLGIYCNDALIDSVAYSTATFPVKAGSSLSLDPSGRDVVKNDDGGYWCRGQDVFGAGDHGTPGAANPECGATSCGDKVVQHWEACDDGNARTGDGCEPDCTSTPPGPACGDGTKDDGEGCDDHNLLSGDGCSATCTVESYAAGSVIVSEFMATPVLAPEATAEWIEVHNATDQSIDIAGWTLTDGAGELVRILPDANVLVVPARGYKVLGRSADKDVNGGVDVDWAWGTALTLSVPADRILLMWNGNEIDRVAWDTEAGWPVATGRSLQLDPSFLDWELNDLAEAWCTAPASVVLPDGDFASPGRENPACP